MLPCPIDSIKRCGKFACLARFPELARAYARTFRLGLCGTCFLLSLNSKAVFIGRRPASDLAQYSLDFLHPTPSRPLLEMLLGHEGGEFLSNRCAYELVDRDTLSASQFLDLFVERVGQSETDCAHFTTPIVRRNS